MKNVLLIIIDALRYDWVTEERMPFLYQWGKKHAAFSNHWATSHCTDPCVTQMLSGKHPDELRLYSMMHGTNYTIPKDVVMLSQTARERGFTTCTISNLDRWYKWGVQHYINCRNWSGQRIFDEAIKQAREMPEPWFMIVHTDDMHTNYTGGSYQSAAKAVDCHVRALIRAVNEDNAWIVVTSDHGEGLGQSGPDSKIIRQHGSGLWDFLTHVPLLTNAVEQGEVGLTDHGVLYAILRDLLYFGDAVLTDIYGLAAVFQAGAAHPYFHRGVVLPDGRQFIREKFMAGNFVEWYVPQELWKDTYDRSFAQACLADHCASHGIDYWDEVKEQEVLERLRGLGYFE